jgi:hypothetical protein
LWGGDEFITASRTRYIILKQGGDFMVILGFRTDLKALKINQMQNINGILVEKPSDAVIGVVFQINDGRQVLVPLTKYDLACDLALTAEQVYALCNDKTRSIHFKDGRKSRLVGYGGYFV